MWSDLHKVVGVMGLPFQLLYAYTGAFMVLAPLLLTPFTRPFFGSDTPRASLEYWGDVSSPKDEVAPRIPVMSLDGLTRRAREVHPRLVPDAYRLFNHGQENGVVEVRGPIVGTTPESYAIVRLTQTDGRILSVRPPANETAKDTSFRWISGLHYAEFGGLSARFLLLFLAIASAATILTGNWIWLERREAARTSVGNRLLGRLTTGVGAGYFVALSALFVASRSLPLGLAARGDAEELVFVAAFAACIAWALLGRDPRAVWWRQLGLAGGLLLLVPVLSARSTPAGLFGSGPRHPTVLGVDVALLASALVLCTVSIALRRHALRPQAPSPKPLPAGTERPPKATLVESGAEDV
jgi:hypothetical protein